MENVEIDRIVSATAWTRFPELLESIEIFLEEFSGNEVPQCLISAFAIGWDWLSIRVSTFESSIASESNHFESIDWLEWLIPMDFRHASPLALDHFVTREMQATFGLLRFRKSSGSSIRKLPAPDPPHFSEDLAMAKTSAGAPAPIDGPVKRGRPPKQATPGGPASIDPPVKRGRPPKQATPPPAPSRSNRPAATRSTAGTQKASGPKPGKASAASSSKKSATPPDPKPNSAKTASEPTASRASNKAKVAATSPAKPPKGRGSR